MGTANHEKYQFVRRIPRTNEAAWRIMLSLGLSMFYVFKAPFFVSSRLRSHFRPFFVRNARWCYSASSFLPASSAIFGHFSFRISLSPTFFKCSLLKYLYSLASLTSALYVATTALQRDSLAPQSLAQRHGRQPPEDAPAPPPRRRYGRTLQVRTYYLASQLATKNF